MKTSYQPLSGNLNERRALSKHSFWFFDFAKWFWKHSTSRKLPRSSRQCDFTDNFGLDFKRSKISLTVESSIKGDIIATFMRIERVTENVSVVPSGYSNAENAVKDGKCPSQRFIHLSKQSSKFFEGNHLKHGLRWLTMLSRWRWITGAGWNFNVHRFPS